MSFSDLAADHIANPRCVGPLEGATHIGVAGTPSEGAYMILWFEVTSEGCIRRAAFKTFPCQTATACGSVSATLLTGRTVEQALRLTVEDLSRIVGGIAEGKEHCPRLTIEALQKALCAITT